jgi:flagellar FliJ protein
MARRFPLQSVHELAAERLEAATRRLGQLKGEWQAAEDKLAQLRGFQEEYRRRLAEAVASGLDMVRMRDFHAFLSKIELAIRQQQAEVERRRLEWERGQQQWLEERRQLKTFEVLKARHDAQERVREARRAQREQDEHAQRAHAGRRQMPRNDR